MNNLVSNMITDGINGFLSALLMILIVAPIIFIIGYFYKKSDTYKNEVEKIEKEEEIKKKDDEENKNLEDFINLLEKENNTKEK